MATIFEQLSKDGEKGLESQTPPNEKVVDWIHQRVSTKHRTDLHHPLGFGPSDAAAGDHTHNGVDSKPLYNSTVTALTDLGTSPTTADIRAAVNAINAALRLLGAG